MILEAIYNGDFYPSEYGFSAGLLLQQEAEEQVKSI